MEPTTWTPEMEQEADRLCREEPYMTGFDPESEKLALHAWRLLPAALAEIRRLRRNIDTLEGRP